ncbi:MAG: indole-3-glycerol phosphate synthase TrpC [Dehalococcoidales bacterium]|nr:indole-3-glycerol phosphate synthase TrpC [Dehalococcoidales bacterium]
MILDEIVAGTKKDLEDTKRSLPLNKLNEMAFDQPPAKSLSQALSGDRIKLITEVKKASPSKGVICKNFNPVTIAQTYAANGAAAISVLTEPKYFQGSLDYLKEIKEVFGENSPPLLRKDFICDPYQIFQARACGADCLLLIAAILSPTNMEYLLDLSRDLGMDCLVEVHDEKELEIVLASDAGIIGINNRDLRTFKTDINVTKRLKKLIPDDRIVVSESGIGSKEDIIELQSCGVSNFLVGEALTASPDIAAKMRQLL